VHIERVMMPEGAAYLYVVLWEYDGTECLVRCVCVCVFVELPLSAVVATCVNLHSSPRCVCGSLEGICTPVFVCATMAELSMCITVRGCMPCIRVYVCIYT
jgi:hypothetical protein